MKDHYRILNQNDVFFNLKNYNFSLISEIDEVIQINTYFSIEKCKKKSFLLWVIRCV